MRAANAAAVKVIDPERELRAARDWLDLSDTAANRIAVADRLVELERWEEAIPYYRDGIARSPMPERGPATRLARALYEAKQDAEALSVLENLPATRSDSDRDRADLLRARVLQAVGENEQALALYAAVGERLPGGEAQCRQAALLIELGRTQDARTPLEEVERRLKRLDRFQRNVDRGMYDWAVRTLAELRRV